MSAALTGGSALSRREAVRLYGPGRVVLGSQGADETAVQDRVVCG